LRKPKGIIVYSEQVMGNREVMAGYSLGGGRPAAAVRWQEKIARRNGQGTPQFETGRDGQRRGQKKASEVFDLLEKFAPIMASNKSHWPPPMRASVFRRHGWKANHPVEFMAGV